MENVIENGSVAASNKSEGSCRVLKHIISIYIYIHIHIHIHTHIHIHK